MAQEIVLNFKIKETGESVQQIVNNISELKKTTKQLEEQLEGMTFGSDEFNETKQAIDQLNKEYQKLTKSNEELDDSFMGLNKQIKQTKAELDKFKIGTKEYDNASKKLKELQDRMGDVTDAAKIQGSGFERISSSFGLFRESVGTADFGKAKIALQGVGAAMKAIPIFLVIEGIKFLIEAFDKLKGGTGLIGKAFRAIGDAIGWVIDKISEFSDWLGLTNNALEKQTENTIKAAQEQKTAMTSRYDREIELAKAAGKDVAKLEKEKEQAILKTLKIEIDAIIALAKARGEYTEEESNRIKEIGEEAADIINKQKVSEITEEKKHNDKKKELAEKNRENQKDILKTLNQLHIDSIQKEQEKERAQLEDKFFNLKKEFTEKKATKKQLAQLEDEHQAAIIKLNQKTIAAFVEGEKKKIDEMIALGQKLKDAANKGFSEADKAQEDADSKIKDAAIKRKEFEIKTLQETITEKNNKGIGAMKELQELEQKRTELLEMNAQKEIDAASKPLEAIKKANADKLKSAEETYNTAVDEYEKAKEAEKNLTKEGASYEKIAAAGRRTEVASENRMLAQENIDSIKAMQDTEATLETEKAQKIKLINEQLSSDKKKINKEYSESFNKQLTVELEGYSKWFNTVAKYAMDLWSSINELQKTNRENEINDIQNHLDEETRILQNNRLDKLEALDAEQKARVKIMQDSNKQILADFDKHRSEYIEQQRALGYDVTAIINSTNEERAQLQASAAEKEAKLKMDFENEKLRINYEADQAEFNLKKDAFDKQEILKEKSFEADKKMKIASTIISTITGAIAAFNGMATAIPGPWGLAAGAIAAAAVTTAGAIAVSNISAQKYQKGTAPQPPRKPVYDYSVGGSSSLSGSDQPKPGNLKDTTLFGTGAGQTGINNKPQQVVINEGQPIRAYVLSGDITSAQEAEARLQRKVTGL